MSAGRPVAHGLRCWWWRLRRPTTRGARVLVHRGDGLVLLVRHSYGAGWYLPGGGVHRREEPEAGARRELGEELGLVVGDLELVGTYSATAEHKRDTVWVFSGIAAAGPEGCSGEVAEWGWFPLGALPDGTSPGTRRRLEEWSGRRRPDGVW